MEFWHQYVGLVGTILYIGSYFLLQTGRLSGDGAGYALLNMLGACLVLFSLAFKFNLASSLIQIAWIVISIAGLFRIAMDKRNGSTNDTDVDDRKTANKRAMASRITA